MTHCTHISTDTAKTMARNLRTALAAEGTEISHSRALEFVARSLGHGDWNIASASMAGSPDSKALPRFTRTSPILRSFDEAKAREFYCDFLGFSVEFEHRFAPDLPLYLGLERGGLSVHLSEHHGDASPGATIFVRCEGVRAYHQELISRHYSFNRPGLEELPWGLQMQVYDPFGNRIRFCQQD